MEYKGIDIVLDNIYKVLENLVLYIPRIAPFVITRQSTYRKE